MPAPEPMRYGDDTEIPEEDLEFNADATDINKVFVEMAKSPELIHKLPEVTPPPLIDTLLIVP